MWWWWCVYVVVATLICGDCREALLLLYVFGPCSRWHCRRQATAWAQLQFAWLITERSPSSCLSSCRPARITRLGSGFRSNHCTSPAFPALFTVLIVTICHCALKVEVRCSDGPDVVGMSPVFNLAHDQQVFTPLFL